MEYPCKPKIDEVCLETAKEIDLTTVFGSWIGHVSELNSAFTTAEPYPYIIIPDFLNSEFAERIDAEFPTNIDNREHWHKYDNPIEVKYAHDRLEVYPAAIRRLFMAYVNPGFIRVMQELTGIDNLEYDEWMHGAGLHIHPAGGRLGIHLDYERHPLSGKQRRINIILYMSKGWQPEWQGHTELWDAEKRRVVSPVRFNHAIIFRTNDMSWHGLPEPIRCPPGVYRKSIAYYYVSEFTDEHPGMPSIGCDSTGYRSKAIFRPRPEDEYHPGLAELYKIRPLRRITEADILEHYPEWYRRGKKSFTP